MKTPSPPRLCLLAAAVLALPMLTAQPASAGDVRWSVTFGSDRHQPHYQHRQTRHTPPRHVYRERHRSPRYQHNPPHFVSHRQRYTPPRRVIYRACPPPPPRRCW